MEILELIQSGGKYTNDEYIEMKKLISIKNQNIDLYEKFKKIQTLNTYIINAMKKQLDNNNKTISVFYEKYDENIKLCKHILTNLVEPYKTSELF